MDSAATPTAAPTSCAVDNSPDATPPVSCDTSLMAAIEIAGNAIPMPSPMIAKPGSRSLT